MDKTATARAPVLMFANTDWYLYNFRRSLALEIQSLGHPVLMVSPEGEFGPRMRNLGLRWESLEMRRSSLRPDVEGQAIWRLTSNIASRETMSLAQLHDQVRGLWLPGGDRCWSSKSYQCCYRTRLCLHKRGP